MDRKNYKRTREYLKSGASAKPPGISAAASSKEPDIFISHAASDKALLDSFGMMLRQGCGIDHSRVFYSSNSDQGVGPGREINTAVKDALKGCAVAISAITPNFNRSSYCLAESGAIWVMDKKSIILVCPPLSLGDVKAPTNQQRLLNLTAARDLDTARDMLNSTLDLPFMHTGTWCEARDIFISRAGTSRQQFDASRERGIAAIAAELPIQVAAVAEMLETIKNAERVYAILLDIDRLEQVNKMFGFPAGSLILDEVNSLHEEFGRLHREVLLSSRCGDDTFFSVVYGDEDDAESLAVKMLKSIERIPRQIKRADITLTASAGIAVFRKGESARAWFERAYFACEEARKNGGNRVGITRTSSRLGWS